MRSALVVALAIAGGNAHADSGPKAKHDAVAAYQEGQRRYRAEDYLHAAEQFELAWKLDPDPAYLFNVAQAYRFGAKCTKSIEFYREFLRVVAKPANADAIAGYIRDQEACARAEATPPPQPLPPPVVVVEKPLPPVERPQPVPPVIDDSDPGRGQKRVAIVAGAGAMVAAGVGLGFLVAGNRAATTREELCADGCVFDDVGLRVAELEDRAGRDRAIAITGFSVAGAALVTGVVLYLTAPSVEHRSVTVVPTRRGAAIVVRF
ncbi:MAG: hypothetical protein ABI867_03425 [Kofleriaceae bacterium]